MDLKIAAFDFDYTIINANSNNCLNKLVIEREPSLPNNKTTASTAELNKFKYSDEIENLNVDNMNNTVRMNAIFEYMHSKYHITQQDMIKCLRDVKISENWKKLFRFLKEEKGFELIIISDSNKFLIQTILSANGLLGYMFIEENIFANEANFNDQGRLIITPHSFIHFNRHDSFFNCSNQYCKKNMCKGTVLEAFINKKHMSNTIESNKRRIFYVGDGKIDFCPMLILKKQTDVGFAKKNSALFRLLANRNETSEEEAGHVRYWKNANDILDQLKGFKF